MGRPVKDGVGLDHEERGAGDPPVLSCMASPASRYLAPQLDYLCRSHPTIAVTCAVTVSVTSPSRGT